MTNNEELAMRVKQGDQEAAGELWNRVERFVYSFLSRYFKMGAERYVDPEDFMQEGYLAMMDAVKYYNPEKGYAFTTYMTHSLQKAAWRAMNAKSGTIPLINSSLDVPIPCGGEDGVYLVDILEDPAALEDLEHVEHNLFREQLNRALWSCIRGMKPQSLAVLRGRYLESKSLRQIGVEIGITKQAVSLREKAALKILREHMKDLEPFIHP